MATPTLQQAIDTYKKYVGLTRAQLQKSAPWLKGRPNMLDCAAAFSYVSGTKPEIISCGTWVQHFKNQHVWHTTGLPKRGDVLIFSWDGLGMRDDGGSHDHIGLCVEDVDAKKKTVSYLSADSGSAKIVDLHEVSLRYVAGYARFVWSK